MPLLMKWANSANVKKGPTFNMVTPLLLWLERVALAPRSLCVGIDILAIRLMFATSLAANIENKY